MHDSPEKQKNRQDCEESAGEAQKKGETTQAAPAEARAAAPGRFLRGAGLLRRLLVIPFLLGCLGVVALVLLFRWPRTDPLVCFVTLWPALIWFSLLLPLIVLGIPSIRLRWVLCGFLLWLIGLAATTDVVQCLKFFPGRSRAGFESARFAVRSYLANADARPDRVDFPLRVVTWNVYYVKTASGHEVIRELAELDPDVVFLQEYVGHILDDAVRQSAQFSGYYFGRHGRNVILSRFPIVPLPADTRSPRYAYACRLELAPGFRVTCISVHLQRVLLQSKPLLRSWSKQKVAIAIECTKEQLDGLAGLIDRCGDTSIILAGDFNVPPRYPDLARVTAGLKDCFAANGYGWGRTVPANHRRIPLPLMRIDMIFAPRNARVAYAAAVPTKLSDHNMTLAEVLIPVRRSASTAPVRKSPGSSAAPSPPVHAAE